MPRPPAQMRLAGCVVDAFQRARKAGDRLAVLRALDHRLRPTFHRAPRENGGARGDGGGIARTLDDFETYPALGVPDAYCAAETPASDAAAMGGKGNAARSRRRARAGRRPQRQFPAASPRHRAPALASFRLCSSPPCGLVPTIACRHGSKAGRGFGPCGRRPKGDAPRSEASALGARRLLPARPQPPSYCHPPGDGFQLDSQSRPQKSRRFAK